MRNVDNWNVHWSKLTDKNSFHPGQSIRHNFIKKQILKKDKYFSIMDFGSGNGQMLSFLASKINFKKIYGIEYSQKGIDICKSTISGVFVKKDLTKPNLNKIINEKFDVITCCDVLEHLDNPESVINNAFDLLKKDGQFFITLPGGPMTEFDKSIGHRMHYSPSSLTNLLYRTKFKNFKVKTIGFPFFNLYRLMLLIRGSKLIDDVEKKGDRNNLLFSILGYLFIFLFKFNLNFINKGWQVVAICKK